MLFVAALWAASASLAVADDWETGKAAFAAGDFELALEYFETARDAGLDSPAVHYNIAVTQFRLGNYEDAGKTFELIARRFAQMRALAEYNLGLVALRLDNPDQARVHFLRARESASADPGLRLLASRQLGMTEPEPRPASAWSGVVGLRIGNDDNVTLRDEAGLPVGTTTDSPLIDGFVSVSGPWQRDGGLRAEATAYMARYADAGDFDQSEIEGRVVYDWRPPGWRIEFGMQASAGGVGGKSFDRKTGLNARVIRPLSSSSVLDLGYQYDRVNEADDIYAGIAGARHRVSLNYLWYQDDHRIRVRYVAETNDRQDPGVSPRRKRIGIDYRRLPSAGFGYEAGIHLRDSNYHDLTTPRKEELTTLRGALTYTLQNPWRLQLELLHSNNDSSDGSFAYDRNRVTLGAIRSF